MSVTDGVTFGLRDIERRIERVLGPWSTPKVDRAGERIADGRKSVRIDMGFTEAELTLIAMACRRVADTRGNGDGVAKGVAD